MNKHPDIDLICTHLLQWHKYSLPHNRRVWWWENSKGRHMSGAYFDPFTNPADCQRVMDEVVKRGWNYALPFAGFENYEVQVWNPEVVESNHAVPEGKGATECEAKMNAVKAMMGGMEKYAEQG